MKALSGFNEYQWSNTVTGELLGKLDSLILSADTPLGTQISVKLIPFLGLGCIQTLHTTIEGPKVNISQPPPDCLFVDITASSLTAGNHPDLKYTYWADADATIPVVNPKKVTKSGVYYIKGQTMPECFDLAEFKVVIIEPPAISIIDPEPVNYPETVDITNAYIPGANLTYSYWKDLNATIPLPNPKTVNRDATFYIKATNMTGCSAVFPVVVNIVYEGVVIPNTFTPNGDGVNDQLTVLIDNAIKIKSFKIFNKWGDVVFATTDIYNYWDGSKEGSPLPVGVYYWFVDAVDTSQRKIRKSGSVAILR